MTMAYHIGRRKKMSKKIPVLAILSLATVSVYLAFMTLKSVDWDISDLSFSDDEEEDF